ncbi:MAG: O-antigen ligase family protein [Oleispira sp.]
MLSWRLYQVLLFILPLPFAGVYGWGWGLFSLLSFLSLALKAYELQSLSDVTVKKSAPVIGLLLAAPIVAFIQWLSSSSLSPHDSYLDVIQGFALVSFFTLTVLLLNSRARVERAIWLVIIAAAFQALYGSFMVMTGLEWGFFSEKWAYLGKATGTFVNRNHLAGYLEMSLALGIGFLLASSTRYSGNWQQKLRQLIEVLLSPKIIMRLLLAVMVIGLVMTRSRMGNTAFFASLMIAGGLALLLMKNKSASTTMLLASLLIIDIAIVGTFFGVEKIADRLQGTSIEKESRDEVSRDTFNMWLDHPILGTGAGSYKYTYPHFKSDDVTSTLLYDYAHNDYLEFLAEFGVIAFMLLAIAVALCFYWGLQAMRLRRRPINQGLGFSSCMGIIAIMIHSTVDFNLQIPANAFMFVFMLAIACIARWADLHSDSRSGSQKSSSSKSRSRSRNRSA